MKKNQATRFLGIVACLLITLMASAQQANGLSVFNGKWDIDMKKTDFEQLRVPRWIQPRSLDIKQKKEMLTINSKWYDEGMKQHYYTEYISLDGTSNELILADGSKRVVSFKRNAQGTGFVLSVRTLKPNGDRDRDFTETWALENNGKTLIIDRQASQANDYSIKAYYNQIK